MGGIMENEPVEAEPSTIVNSSVRTREYLTATEIEILMAAARKRSRYGHRDATMILIGYRQLCDLQWHQVEFGPGRLHVRRAKSGSPSVHPMQGDEIRALRRLQREQGPSPHVFMTERDGPMTPKAWHALFGRIGQLAEMPFAVHPHMLRHGCGYALANAGHDTRSLQTYLGHKNIQHTVRYTELAPDRFKDFWRGRQRRAAARGRRPPPFFARINVPFYSAGPCLDSRGTPNPNFFGKTKFGPRCPSNSPFCRRSLTGSTLVGPLAGADLFRRRLEHEGGSFSRRHSARPRSASRRC
jgi:Phage integrase family